MPSTIPETRHWPFDFQPSQASLSVSLCLTLSLSSLRPSVSPSLRPSLRLSIPPILPLAPSRTHARTRARARAHTHTHTNLHRFWTLMSRAHSATSRYSSLSWKRFDRHISIRNQTSKSALLYDSRFSAPITQMARQAMCRVVPRANRKHAVPEPGIGWQSTGCCFRHLENFENHEASVQPFHCENDLCRLLKPKKSVVGQTVTVCDVPFEAVAKHCGTAAPMKPSKTGQLSRRVAPDQCRDA